MSKITELSAKLGYKFKDAELLKQALTHSSYVNEIGLDRDYCNERMEFLGDALLEMIVSRILYHQIPVLSEGKMTKLRADLVCEKTLCTLAEEIDLGSHLQLGRGEIGTGGRNRPSILADAFEALIASIYLDGGLEPTVDFVERMFLPLMDSHVETNNDYKTHLQEYIQNRPGMHLEYKLLAQEGPDHNKTFTVEVLVNGKSAGIGNGKSKKSAQQAAAKEALFSFKER